MASMRAAIRTSGILRSCTLHGLRRNVTNQGTASVLSSLQTVSGSRSLVSLTKSNWATSSFRKTFVTAAVCSLQASIATDPLGETEHGQAGVLEQELDEDEEQNHRKRERHSFHDKEIINKVQLEMEKSAVSGKIFAIIHIGGRQFKITINDTIGIDRIDAETGDRLRLEKVLLVGGTDFTLIGRPLLEHDIVRIEATVIEKTKSDPVQVFKKKRRKNYIRWKEHQQDRTILRINSIDVKPAVLH